MKTLCVESMALIFAHMPFLKQAVGQILQPTVEACTGIVCKTCFDLVVCHICHICPSVERCTKHSVLCSVRKLFGATDPGLDTDQRFIGAST